ncbi:phosphoglycerate kinase [Candidatus Pacearchaeota archaeon]|nr:phosphoglycerate kinase [Candidatus Pacearchaeota archaeon]
MKTLDDLNFYDKTVLLRADLNSEVDNGKVIFSERIRESIESIFELKRRGAKVVVIAHQGRPGSDDFTTLKSHAKFIHYYTKIKFIEDIIGEKAVNAIERLRIGEAILLENIRFEKDEFKPDKRTNVLIKNLVPLADIYVNDAFSVCHRNHTSVVGFPKHLPSCAGRLLERELKALEKIDVKNSLFVLGGAKPEDNIRLLKRKNKVLSCGYFCHLALIAKGINLGEQENFLKKEIKNFDKIIRIIKRKIKQIETPVDFAIEEEGKRKEVSIEELPVDKKLLDIGEKTIQNYISEIKKAKSIFLKGPSGEYSDKRFRKGTYEILYAVSQIKGFSLLGGGHSNEAVKQCRIARRKFSYISLSGGALIRYLAGEKLPGLKALEKW